MKIINYFRFIITMLMVSIFIPIVSENIPFLFSYYFQSAIFLSSILFLKPSVFLKKSNLLSLSFLIMFFIFMSIDLYEINNIWIIKNIFPIFLSITVINYFRVTDDVVGQRNIVRICLILIVVTSLITIIINIAFPFATRTYYSTTSESIVNFYDKLGIGGYGLATGIVLLFPLIQLQYRKSKDKQKKLFLLLNIILFFSVLATSITVSVFLMVLGIAISFIGYRLLKKYFIMINIIVIILLVTSMGFYSNIFYRLADLTSNEVFQLRINNIGYMFEIQEIDVDNPHATELEIRLSRYKDNWDVFVNNDVFFGNGIGGNYHLYWVHFLSQFGLIGFGFYIFILANEIKKNMMRIKEVQQFYYILSVILFVLTGLLKVIVGQEMFMIFFFIIPSLAYLDLKFIKD